MCRRWCGSAYLAVQSSDDVGGMSLGEEIFVDEQPDYYTFAQDTHRKTGAEVIAEAKAAGFAF